MDLAQRIDISEKLREQVRELEREKRDLQRRYNEQVRNVSQDFIIIINRSFLDSHVRGGEASIV